MPDTLIDYDEDWDPRGEGPGGAGEERELRPHEIDEQDLNGEFLQLPADIAYANGQLADAQKRYLEAKHTLEEEESRLYLICREELEDERGKGGNKVTEAMIRGRVVDQDRYINARVDKVEAEAALQVKKGEVEALRAKRDMLIQLGAQLRAEMESDPTIRTQRTRG